MKYNITKCICYDTTFGEMKIIMEENKLNSIEELREFKPVALDCKLCIPYISKMIETGTTIFEIIIE